MPALLCVCDKHQLLFGAGWQKQVNEYEATSAYELRRAIHELRAERLHADGRDEFALQPERRAHAFRRVDEGVEAGADVRFGAGWTVGGDLMWLHTKYERGASFDGNRVAAGHVTYTVPSVPGLKVGADAKFTGNTTVRPAGDLKAGGYTLFNVDATYATKMGGYGVTFRAALDNIANRRYWEYQYADYISPGDPRTVSLNARVDF